MSKVFYDDSGIPYPLPVGFEEGKRYRKVRYIDPENPCPECGKLVFYTKNRHCVHCARIRACDLHAYAIGKMTIEYNGSRITTKYPIDPRLPRPVSDREIDTEFIDEMEAALELLPSVVPFSRRQAIENDSELWLTGDPCNKAGHFGIRTLKGDCYYCEQERKRLSPRQEAIKNGENWYMPSHPCPRCGKIAKRAVYGGACKGCKGAQTGKKRESDDRETPDSVMMKKNPDLILTPEQARLLGLKVYRTGRPCKHGHKGFRYLSTGMCIDCLRGRS